MMRCIGLVGGDEFALAPRRIHPLAYGAKAEDRVAIRLRRWRLRHRIRLKTRDDRRVIGVRDAEAPEKQRAAGAVALAAARPDLHDALDVGLRLGRQALARMAAADVHRHRAAQRLEAGVHLRADRARYVPCARVSGPELLLGIALGDGLADCERVPYRLAVDDEDRHLARGGIVLDALGAAGVVELELHFLERDARLTQQYPGTHRPGRVILVSASELHAGQFTIGRCSTPHASLAATPSRRPQAAKPRYAPCSAAVATSPFRVASTRASATDRSAAGR